MAYEVEIRELSARPIAGQRKVLPMEELPEFFGAVFGGLYGLLTEFGVPLLGAPIAVYHSLDQGTADVEAAVPLGGHPPGGTPKAMNGEPIIFRDLEGGPAAYTLHVGPYERLMEAYGALQQWVERTGHEPRGVWYEIYLSDPEEEPDPERWRTEIYLPLRG